MTCQEFAEICDAAALRALGRHDALAVEEHALGCRSCRAELARVRSVVALIGFTADQIEPPARLKARIIEAARADVTPPARRFVARVLRPAFGRIGLVASAAAVLLAVSTGILSYALWDQLQEANRRSEALAEVLNIKENDFVQLISARPEYLTALTSSARAPQARGRVYASNSSNTALVIVEHLPVLGPDRTYQVWFMEAGIRRDGGTHSVDADGRGRWVVHAPDSINRYQAITITDEPAGGSAQPTTSRLLGGIFQ